MEYITVKEASVLWNVTTRRIQQMCKNGEIKGLNKEGKTWLIPSDFIPLKTNINKNKKNLPLPIGISDFKKAVTEYYYVDKTLLIKDFLDNKPQVSLFTRPRRFGKTLTMDMLKVFFEKTKEDNSIYFKDKAIWLCGEEYTKYQGQYPVIFLTFKDVKCTTWEETYKKIVKLIALEYSRHNDLFDSDRLTEFEKKQFVELANCQATTVDYQMSLQFLSMLLKKHYNMECIVIIDEYDTPIEQGHTHGFYDKIIDFMRGFFSGGLKDNSCLAYGFLTGILRVAKESIFSGLNNIKINSILDEYYSQYFGFTKSEVKNLLKYYNQTDKYKEVCSWYDGYIFGKTEIFNPWSVINYVSEKCFPKAFWQSTGSNEIIGEIIEFSTNEIKENLNKLLSGNTISTYIDTNVIYPDLKTNPYSIYSFLLVAGYLKVQKNYPQHDGSYMCDVAIPNKEIAFVYEKEVLNKMGKESISIMIQQAIYNQDVQKLKELLENYILEAVSTFDGSNEGFYHGMMLGLCAILSNRYRVSSNRESGYGRFDIELFPEDSSNPGFIFEIKHSKIDTENLDSLAQKALNQINEKLYDTNMKSKGVKNICKVGIAFRGKNVSVISH